MLLWIGLWAARIFIGVAGSVGSMYLIFMFSKTRLAGWLWDRIIFKLNGYKEAKIMAAQRRVNTPPKPPKPEAPPRGPGILTRAWRRFKKMFYDDDEDDRIVTRTLTFFGIVGAFIWAMKKRACPLVVFVDDAPAAVPPPKPVAESDPNAGG